MSKNVLVNKTDNTANLCFRNLLPVRVQSVIPNLWHGTKQLHGSASYQTGTLNCAYHLCHILFAHV